MIVCDVVVAEVAAAFPSAQQAADALDAVGVVPVAVDSATALAAGESWREYRRRGGRRERVVADFLIAAHAISHAQRLLTRDRGFYRRYFEALEIVDPGATARR